MKFQTILTDDRKLNLNWESINQYLSKWKPGTAIEVEIVRRVPRRSDPLRKYYFAAVLPPFMEHLGYDPEEEMIFHRQLKIVFFKIKRDERGIRRGVPSVFSNESDIPVSIKKKFVDWVIRKASEYGAYIPDPGE